MTTKIAMLKNNYIFLISGPPGSGKTSLSKILLKSFARGVHLELDFFRKFVISGFTPPIPQTASSEIQAMVAYENAVFCAKNYYEKGFSVVIDEVSSSPAKISKMLDCAHFKSILLLPDINENQIRNLDRKNKSFDPDQISSFISSFNSKLKASDQSIWDCVVDNTSLTPEETTDYVIQSLKLC